MKELTFVEQTVLWAGEEFVFSNQRVLFHKNSKSLICSDVHLGKTTHFRQNGIAVPESIAKKDLGRLEQCILHFQPTQIIIAGDFFHAGANREMGIFQEWKAQFPNIQFHLVKGNHDRLTNTVYDDLDFHLYSKMKEFSSFIIQHHPEEEPIIPQISGHIHPGIVIQGKAKQRLRLPCFLVNEKQIILPAFSLFTGLDTGKVKQGFEAIAFGDQEMFHFNKKR